MAAPRFRRVALGASNLSLGLSTVLALTRGEKGPDFEVVVADGYGRSYGVESDIPFRRLPAILDCGLWRVLREEPVVSTSALVTDVGNDILYGFDAGRIVDWVNEAVTRLREHTDDVTVTGLPLASIEDLSSAAFLFFRTLFYPPCRLSLREVRETARLVDGGLRDVAGRAGARFVEPSPEWFALDPIHVRPGAWRAAWTSYLGAEASGTSSGFSPGDWIRAQRHSPERRWILSVEQTRAQSAVRPLKRGGVLRAY